MLDYIHNRIPGNEFQQLEIDTSMYKKSTTQKSCDSPCAITQQRYFNCMRISLTNWTETSGMIAVVLAALCTASPVGSETLDFDYTTIDSNPPSGSSCCLDICAIGDIDGDGINDIVVGSESSIGVVWYHAPTWTRYVIGAGAFTTDGEVVDVDNDGDFDVVISSISPKRIEWWENLGDPFSTSGWTQHTIGDNFAHDVAVGDIDKDGNVDVAVFRKNSEIVWFEAPDDPRNNWTERNVSSSSGEGLDIGDIDGDGNLDIAGSRNWYENADGAGTSWLPHSITASWGMDCRDIIADMDGDGDNDVVLSHSEDSGQIAWFENPGWTKHTIDSGNISEAHSLEVADFDLDHDLDVMSGQMHTSSEKRVMVYENRGPDAVWIRTVLATSGTHNARVGDINNDQKPDIVGKNYDGSKQVEAWINTTYSAVTIAAFGASTADGRVIIEWALADADGLSGYDIYRGAGGNPDVRINPVKLPPETTTYVDDSVEPGRSYTYQLAAYDRDGKFLSRTVTVSVPVPVIALEPSHPNPFRSSTTIGFQLPGPSRVKLTVHDVAGRFVATVLDEARGDGFHEIEWNGRNARGQRVQSGIYFIRLDTGKRVLVRKVVVVK
jgi:hypothetical protein